MNDFYSFLTSISRYYNSGEHAPVQTTIDHTCMSSENWNTLSEEERWSFILYFINYQAKAIGLTDVPTAGRISGTDPHISRYIRCANLLEINLSKCTNLYDTLELIAHDLNYALQEQAIKSKDVSKYSEAELLLLCVQKKFYDPGMDSNNPFYNSLSFRNYMSPKGSLKSIKDLSGTTHFDIQMTELDSAISGTNAVLANTISSKLEPDYIEFLKKRLVYFGNISNLLINHPDICDKSEEWQLSKAVTGASFTKDEIALAKSAIGSDNSVRLHALRMTSALCAALISYIEPFATANHNRCCELLLSEQSRSLNASELEKILNDNRSVAENLAFIGNEAMDRSNEILSSLSCGQETNGLLTTKAEQQKQLSDLKQIYVWCKKQMEVLTLDSRAIKGMVSTDEYHTEMILLGSAFDSEDENPVLYSVYTPYVTFCLKRASEVHLAVVSTNQSSSIRALHMKESAEKRIKMVQKPKARLEEMVPAFEQRIQNIQDTRASYEETHDLSYEELGGNAFIQTALTELRTTELALKDIRNHIALLDTDIEAIDPKAAEKKKAAERPTVPHYALRRKNMTSKEASSSEAKPTKESKESKESKDTTTTAANTDSYIPPYLRKKTTSAAVQNQDLVETKKEDDEAAPGRPTPKAASVDDEYVPPYMRARKAAPTVAPASSEDEDDDEVAPVRPTPKAASADDEYVPPYMRARKAAPTVAPASSEDEDDDEVAPVRPSAKAASSDDEYVPPYLRARKTAPTVAPASSEDEDDDEVAPVRPSAKAASSDDEYVPPYLRARKAAPTVAPASSEDEDDDEVAPVRPSAKAASSDDEYVPPYMRARKAAPTVAPASSEDEDDDEVAPVRPTPKAASADDEYVPPYMRARKAAPALEEKVDDEDDEVAPVRPSAKAASSDDEYVPPYMRARKAAPAVTEEEPVVAEDEEEEKVDVAPVRPTAKAAPADDEYVPPYLRARKTAPAVTEEEPVVAEDEEEEKVDVAPVRPSAKDASADDEYVPPYLRARKTAPAVTEEEPVVAEDEEEEKVDVAPVRPTAKAAPTDDEYVPPYLRARKAAPAVTEEEPVVAEDEEEEKVDVAPVRPTPKAASADDEYVPPYLRARRPVAAPTAVEEDEDEEDPTDNVTARVEIKEEAAPSGPATNTASASDDEYVPPYMRSRRPIRRSGPAPVTDTDTNNEEE